MRPKTFFISALACALAVLAACAALVAWTDPLLTAGGLEEGGSALFVNERYELAGLIRRQEYTSVVMGTSSVANFRASWFTRGTGEKTLKITFPDGRLSEFDTALDLAFRTHGELDTVYFCLDPTVLVREEQVSELPQYLYNDDPLDDLQFYLNGESVALAVRSLVLGEAGKVPLDDAYVWEGEFEFSWWAAMRGYTRPEAVDAALPEDAFLPAAERNMDLICGWLEAHPDTRFVVWFPPYSLLFWDKMCQQGRTEAVLEAVRYAASRLMEHGNAQVHCFLHDLGHVTELGYYTDHIHCSAEVTAWVAQMLMEGKWRLTPDNCAPALQTLRDYLDAYDFELLFQSYREMEAALPQPDG